MMSVCRGPFALGIYMVILLDLPAVNKIYRYSEQTLSLDSVISRAAHFLQNKQRPPPLIGQPTLAYLCWKLSQAENQNIDMSRVLPAGVLGNVGKSGDVCNVIFGRPAVFSRCKNAQNVH